MVSNTDSYIGEQIRKRRHILGMSQSDLANQIGVTFQQIQKYEKGQNKIMASRLLELSHIMNVDIQYFFKNCKPDNSNQAPASLNEEAAEFQYKLNETPQEALKLVKIYNKIPNDKAKKKLLLFLKSLTETEET